ncbi:MAG: hypothetical protein PHD51_01035 [Patescibacteria group bacterium]|nr:hypothetical protein [Patescibacteria group bacterium]MDD5490553.1 hypothetical protein [Patescibacteria group bacterium]
MDIFRKLFGKKEELPSGEEVVNAINSAKAGEIERHRAEKDLDLEIEKAFGKATAGELERKEASAEEIELHAWAEKMVDSYLGRNLSFKNISFISKMRGEMIEKTVGELRGKKSNEWEEVFNKSITPELDTLNPEA